MCMTKVHIRTVQISVVRTIWRVHLNMKIRSAGHKNLSGNEALSMLPIFLLKHFKSSVLSVPGNHERNRLHLMFPFKMLLICETQAPSETLL